MLLIEGNKTVRVNKHHGGADPVEIVGRGDYGKDMNGRAVPGQGGYCVCPNCAYRVRGEMMIPCYLRKCPRCGILMTGE